MYTFMAQYKKAKRYGFTSKKALSAYLALVLDPDLK